MSKTHSKKLNVENVQESRNIGTLQAKIDTANKPSSKIVAKC